MLPSSSVHVQSLTQLSKLRLGGSSWEALSNPQLPPVDAALSLDIWSQHLLLSWSGLGAQRTMLTLALGLMFLVCSRLWERTIFQFLHTIPDMLIKATHKTMLPLTK